MTVVIDSGMAEAEVNAIGISFGNSNSSIAYTTGVRDELSLSGVVKLVLIGSPYRKERQK